MTRAVVPFRRWHLAWLLEAGKAVGGQAQFDIDTLLTLEKHNNWTVVIDGEPMACGGTLQQWPGRHIAWMYLNAKSGPHMRYLTRVVKEGLEKVVGRVEFTVRRDFDLGNRWAQMLGFEVEAPVLRAFGPDGEDHVGYVRINKG